MTLSWTLCYINSAELCTAVINCSFISTADPLMHASSTKYCCSSLKCWDPVAAPSHFKFCSEQHLKYAAAQVKTYDYENRLCSVNVLTCFSVLEFRMKNNSAVVCMCVCVCWGLRSVRVAQPKHVVTHCVSFLFSLILFFTIMFSVLHHVLHAKWECVAYWVC